MKKKHAERKWTVMLVPHGSGSSRAVEVSQTVVKALVGIGSVVALLFLVLGGTALSRGVSVTRSRALERENQLLASEVQRLREHLVGLRDTINVIGEREQALRLLAGLSPIDKDVQQAGIGFCTSRARMKASMSPRRWAWRSTHPPPASSPK